MLDVINNIEEYQKKKSWLMFKSRNETVKMFIEFWIILSTYLY